MGVAVVGGDNGGDGNVKKSKGVTQFLVNVRGWESEQVSSQFLRIEQRHASYFFRFRILGAGRKVGESN